MNELVSCLLSTNGMAYATGVLIFLITLFLVYKRVIGFTLTLLFLLFALCAALAVANQNAIRNYMDSLSQERKPPSEAPRQAQSSPTQEKSERTISDKMQRALDDLKDEFEIYKKKFLDFMAEQREKQKEESQKNPPESP